MVTELVKGKTLGEAQQITNRTVAEALMACPDRNALFQSGRRCPA